MSEENIQTAVDATEAEVAVESSVEEKVTTQEIDYQKKFSESSREAQRLLDELKEKERIQAEKDAEIERLRKLAESNDATTSNESDLYPGFEFLSEEQQRDIIAFKEGIKKNALKEIYSDPAIAFAKQSYNERKWNEALDSLTSKYPDIRESKEDFKAKYYNPNNVPDNIGNILEDLAKVYLFDKARDLGAKEAIEKSNHIDIERSGGGDKTPETTTRSKEDWYRMAQENPALFAKMSGEFRKDLESGKLK